MSFAHKMDISDSLIIGVYLYISDIMKIKDLRVVSKINNDPHPFTSEMKNDMLPYSKLMIRLKLLCF